MKHTEVTQVLSQLDAIVDGAKTLPVMAAASFLRCLLFDRWREDECRALPGGVLPGLLAPLSDGDAVSEQPGFLLCLLRPLLFLCQADLPSPASPKQRCERHAQSLRALRRWRSQILPRLATEEPDELSECDQLLRAHEALADEGFAKCLALLRTQCAMNAARLRAELAAERERARGTLFLPDVRLAVAKNEAYDACAQEKKMLAPSEIAPGTGIIWDVPNETAPPPGRKMSNEMAAE